MRFAQGGWKKEVGRVRCRSQKPKEGKRSSREMTIVASSGGVISVCSASRGSTMAESAHAESGRWWGLDCPDKRNQASALGE